MPEALRTRGEIQPKTQTRAGQKDKSAPAQQSADEVVLYHAHLPKLAERGLIEWERDTNTVSRGPKFVAIEPALNVLLSNTTAFPPDLL